MFMDCSTITGMVLCWFMILMLLRRLDIDRWPDKKLVVVFGVGALVIIVVMHYYYKAQTKKMYFDIIGMNQKEPAKQPESRREDDAQLKKDKKLD